jgi:hypothetical protein
MKQGMSIHRAKRSISLTRLQDRFGAQKQSFWRLIAD